MAGRPLFEGHLDTAEDQLAARDEPVQIVSDARPAHGVSSRVSFLFMTQMGVSPARTFLTQVKFRERQIAWPRYLQIAFGSQHHVNVASHPFYQSRFVRSGHPVRRGLRESLS